MVVSPVASPAVEELFAPYEVVTEIGSRPSPLYVVRQSAQTGRPKLLVAERFVGVAKQSDGLAFMSEARRISTLASPNVARVRDLAPRGDDLVVFWDFIDGERLEEIWLSGAMPLEVALRVILDVLSGVGAIHGLRDAKQQPMHLAHGEISTATVVLGLDGVARVMHAVARRLPNARAEETSLGYLAPEVHARAAYDARADIFSVGVLLWEALSGKRLFDERDAAAIVERVRTGNVAPAAVSDKAAWAKGLVQVAAKALAASPDDRWSTAAAMAGEIRKVAGLKLAPAMAAVTFAKAAMGERAKVRRERFESGVGQRPVGLPQPSRREPAAAVSPKVAPPPAKAFDAREVVTNTDIELVPDSMPPPALAFSSPQPVEPVGAVLVPSPPPLPLRAVLPSRPNAVLAPQVPGDDQAATNPQPLRREEENTTPYFDAAIDVPISMAPPPTDPVIVSPASVEQTPAFVQPDRARRLRGIVLGGVATLGIVVFVLVAWRVAHPSTDTVRQPRGEHPVSASVATSLPVHASAPSPRVDGVSLAPTPATAAATVSPVPRAARPAPPLVGPAPAPKASGPSAPIPKPSAPPVASPKPPPTSGYHPSSL